MYTAQHPTKELGSEVWGGACKLIYIAGAGTEGTSAEDKASVGLEDAKNSATDNAAAAMGKGS